MKTWKMRKGKIQKKKWTKKKGLRGKETMVRRYKKI